MNKYRMTEKFKSQYSNRSIIWVNNHSITKSFNYSIAQQAVHTAKAANEIFAMNNGCKQVISI